MMLACFWWDHSSWPMCCCLPAGPSLQALAGSKVACDYSNRLCQWNATYAVGGAVLGDLVGDAGWLTD
jgi:hypothetical protein